MLSSFKHSKHQKHLAQLPKILQTVEDIETLYSPKEFCYTLFNIIANAKQRICLVALYLEQDQGGQGILDALFKAKQTRPQLKITILVDWHRAQRNRIGITDTNNNADWYCHMAQSYPGIKIPVYGVPVNIREILGVLHLKGYIVDDQVIYSGANLNDVYLHQGDKYRYDRYQIIRNRLLADAMQSYIDQQLLTAPAVSRLDNPSRPRSLEIKNDIRLLRQALRGSSYRYHGNASLDELAITPLVGLGKQNILNKTIHHLMCATNDKLTLCTPYFNLPNILVHNLINLLRHGRKVEIIVGDKTANDFYIHEDQPFKMIGTLPYLYEINLRCFLSKLQRYIDNGQLIVRLWRNGNNSYHLKGMWVDNAWQLLTGNNLNSRAWWLDLENALLIHDPKQVLCHQRDYELAIIRLHTQSITHYTTLQCIADYPVKVRKLISRLRRIRMDRLISRIL